MGLGKKKESKRTGARERETRLKGKADRISVRACCTSLGMRSEEEGNGTGTPACSLASRACLCQSALSR